VASTWPARAQTEPARISENFSSAVRAWSLRLKIVMGIKVVVTLYGSGWALAVIVGNPAGITVVQQRAPPVLVGQVPVDGGVHSGREGMFRDIFEFGLGLGGVDRVAPVMALAVGDEGEQFPAGLADSRRTGGIALSQAGFLGETLVEGPADQVDQIRDFSSRGCRRGYRSRRAAPWS